MNRIKREPFVKTKKFFNLIVKYQKRKQHILVFLIFYINFTKIHRMMCFGFFLKIGLSLVCGFIFVFPLFL